MGKQKNSKSNSKPCLVNQHECLAPRSGVRPVTAKSKSKKQKFIKKEKKLVKGPVGTGSETYHRSKAPPAQVEKLLAQVDSGIASSITNYNQFQPNAFSLIVQAWIEMLARFTPLFIGIDPEESVSPLEAWLYAFTIMYAAIKRHGRLSSANAQYVVIDDDTEVELSLAKIVQQYFPFIDGEVNFKMTAAPDFNVTISTGSLDSSISSYAIFGGLLPYADGTFERYDQLIPYTASGVNQGVLIAVSSSLAPVGPYLTWVQNRFPTVANIISKTTGVNTVRLSAISQTAPDASAYSARTTAVGTQYIINYSNRRNKELAFILSYGSFDANPIAAFLDPPIVANQFSLNYTFSVPEQYLARCLMYTGWHQKKWSSGPVDEWTLFDQKLTTFNFRSQFVTGDAFNANWQKLYTALRDINTSFTDNTNEYGGPLSGLMLWNWVMNIILHKKCDISSPIALTKSTKSNQNNKALQQYYNPGMPGLNIPPGLKKYIDLIGPIVQNGEVVFPLLKTKYYASVDTNLATLMAMSTDYWNPIGNKNDYFPFSANEAIASPNIKLNEVIYNATFKSGFDAACNASGYGCIMPNTFFPELTNAIAQTTAAIGGIQNNLVSNQDCNPCPGACSVMGTIGFGERVTVVSSPLVSTVSMTYIATDRVRSTCNLTSEEAMAAACYALNVTATTNAFSQRGPYAIALPRFSNAQAVLDNGYAKFFAPNLFDPGSDDPSAGCVRVDGMVVSKIPAVGNETAEKSYDQYFSTAANSMLGTLRTAACSGVAVGVGQIPVLGAIASPLAKSLCDAGLPRLFNFVAHRASIFSSESSIPKPIENCFNVRGLRIEAFKRALPCMLKAVNMQGSVKQLAPVVYDMMERWKKASLSRLT